MWREGAPGAPASRDLQSTGGMKIVVFGCLFFNDFEMILGYFLGYHFGVKSVKSHC